MNEKKEKVIRLKDDILKDLKNNKYNKKTKSNIERFLAFIQDERNEK